MLVSLHGINSNFINRFPEGSFFLAITRRKLHFFRIILLLSLTLVSLLERSVTGDQTLDSALVLHCSGLCGLTAKQEGFGGRAGTSQVPYTCNVTCSWSPLWSLFCFLKAEKYEPIALPWTLETFGWWQSLLPFSLPGLDKCFGRVCENIWPLKKIGNEKHKAGEEKGHGDPIPESEVERTFSLNSGTLERFG